ncbi:hypothetical protein BT401P3_00035 [Bacteroides phage BT401P3]|nr:hypothetical protein BT401P2_00005 [Bacteroides phage BT401P2]WAX09231.1 hypothetical protein BT401P3_00035 [Bacteroides phage BT401P3]
MVCKYDIIDEGGRKRVRALRSFTVQGRDVCPMELGGYVYDDKTLSQDGKCWIFSGSLEYPGVRVMDEAIVDMGINLASPVTARPKSVVISGNSRIMGPLQFTGFESTSQVGIVWEQGALNAWVGMVPVKGNASIRVRTQAPLFCGSAGKVAITSTAYEARLISLDEAGIVVSASAWTVGGPAVTLTSTAPNILVELRKVGETAITPADVATAGVTVTTASETSLEITNSSIITLYNGAVANANNIFNLRVFDGKSTAQNSSIRIEAFAASSNALNFLADFDRVNAIFTPEAGVSTTINGIYIRSNVTAPGSLTQTGFTKSRQFVVKDCPEFVWSATVFPIIADFRSSGKVFTFNRCNMPAGSAILYYDPKVNVWDNIDFTKAMADLGKKIGTDTYVVSSNVQGMYRLRSVSDKAWGAMIQSFSSISGAAISTLSDTYDSVIYKDCVIKGLFGIKGRNVFGGTLGGASGITNTQATAMVVDGNFRIERNAQVTDTPLKGTGYIGGNAELKNGVVEGYIYMDGNAKYIPGAVTNAAILKNVIMTGNSKVLKQRDVSNNHVKMELSDNAVVDSVVSIDRGFLKMSGNAYLYSAGAAITPVVYGTLEMKDNAKQVGGTLATEGDVTLCGGYNQTSGSPTIRGKRTIANVSEITAVELPPTKITW